MFSIPSQHLDLQQIQILEKIGQGGMSTVWKVSHSLHNHAFALKVLEPRKKKNEYIYQELLTLALLDHPNVIRILDFGQITTENPAEHSFPKDSFWLLFEYVKGQSIVREAENKEWPFIRRMILQLLKALAHTHSRGIIHRDICPGNVLWCQRERCLKIIDFGIALQKEQSKDHFSGYGSYGYAAPEVIKGNNIGPWSDLYSAGWLFSVMLSHVTNVPKGVSAWLNKLTHPIISHRFLRAADAIHAFSLLPPLASEDVLEEKPILHVPITTDNPITATVPLSSPLPTLIIEDPSPQKLKQDVPPFPENWRGETESTVALDWALPSISLLPLRLPKLVGRQQEQDWLWKHLKQTITEKSLGILQLGGESGIGITRLMHWFEHRAHETGAADVLFLSSPTFDLEILQQKALIRPQIVLFDGTTEDLFPALPPISSPILFVLGRAQYNHSAASNIASHTLKPLDKKYWLALLDSFATITPMTASWLSHKGAGHPAKQRAILEKLLKKEYLIQGKQNLVWIKEPAPPPFTLKKIEQEIEMMNAELTQGIEAINIYPLHCMWNYLQSYPLEKVADVMAIVWRKLSNSAIDIDDRLLLKKLLQQTHFLPYTTPKENFRVKRRIIHLNMALNNYEQTNKLSLALLDSLTEQNSREYLLAHWQYSLDLFLQGKLSDAYSRYLLTKERAIQLQAKDIEIYSLIGMGISRGYAGDFAQSIQLLMEAENMLMALEQTFTTGTLYEMYTVNYLGLDELEKAKKAILKCFQIHQQQGKTKPINALMLWLAIEHALDHQEQVSEIVEELEQRKNNIEPSVQAHIYLYHYWYSMEEYEKIAYWNKHLVLLEHHPSIDTLLGSFYKAILTDLPIPLAIKASIEETYIRFWNKLGWNVAAKWQCYPL